MKYTTVSGKRLSSMSLGTVQLGMNYGIANNAGKPDEAKSHAILRAALEGGVTSIDTARVYGNSEEVIGNFFKTYDGELPFITTKLPKLEGDSDAELEKYVITSIESSLERLSVKRVNAVMLHVAGDLFARGAAGARAMNSIVRHGYADVVGASIYTADEAEEMMKYPEFTVTQLPMSIFDQRLIASGIAAKLKERGYTVFVRSVFLQGLFFLDPDKLDDPILTEHAVPKIRLLREIAASEGMTVAELAIAFMRDTVGVTSLVLGADTPDQVRENIGYFDAPEISPVAMKRLHDEFAAVNIPEIMKVLSRPKK